MNQTDVRYNKWKNSGSLGKVYNIRRKAYIIATVDRDYNVRTVGIYSTKDLTCSVGHTQNIIIETYSGTRFSTASRKAIALCPKWVKPWVMESREYHEKRYDLYKEAREGSIKLPEQYHKLAELQWKEYDTRSNELRKLYFLKE